MKKSPLRIVTCCLAGALVFATPIYISAAPTAGITEYASTIIENELNTSSPVAGVSLAFSGYLEKNRVAQPMENEDEIVGQEDTAEEQADEDKKEEKKEKKSSKYDKMAVAQVNDYVNIRKKPDENSKLLGKLYSDSVATVLKEKDGWYKIQSGSVTGFVKGDYIVVGDEALIRSVGVPVATVSTTTLKVRSKASGKSDVLTLVPGGEELAVSSMKQYKDGWVKVAVEGGHGFVSSDYVEITREYAYAESKAEEEARLALEQARLEAERQAAADAAAAAADNTDTNTGASNTTSNSTGSSGSSSTGSSSGGTSSTGSSSNASPSSAPSDTGSSSSSASGSGQAVVNYASQFIGNPYVYGGSSLTNGTDCSGFVMSVYAHFGISLPHSSSALRGVGYAVSASSMQPGDIVCYDGHVAIYVGNNTIIHASTVATGIKYTSPANYRTIVAVRRIF